MRKPRMSQSQIARLGRLLWMRYKPSELADELGCSVDTIYKSYVPSGCPHQRDDATGLMGWPIGWTVLEPLATDKYQQWLEQHGRC